MAAHYAPGGGCAKGGGVTMRLLTDEQLRHLKEVSEAPAPPGGSALFDIAEPGHLVGGGGGGGSALRNALKLARGELPRRYRVRLARPQPEGP